MSTSRRFRRLSRRASRRARAGGVHVSPFGISGADFFSAEEYLPEVLQAKTCDVLT